MSTTSNVPTADEHRTPLAQDETCPPEATGGATVLVADGDGAVLDVLCDTLELAGFQCLRATDVATAAALVASAGPDVIVADGELLAGSGRATPAPARGEGARRPPVLMMTALLDGGVARPDVDDRMAKPFTIGELVARVNALLRAV